MEQEGTAISDQAGEIERLSSLLMERVFKLAEDASGSSDDTPAFREVLHLELETIALAKGSRDLDALRVLDLFSGTYQAQALMTIIRSVRNAGHQEVFPMTMTLRIPQAVETISALRTEYEENNTGLLPDNEIFNAVRGACAMGTEKVADYIAANPMEALAIATKRNVTDSDALIGLLGSMLVDSITPLMDGSL